MFLVPPAGEDPPNLYSADCGVEKELPGGRALRPVRRLYFGSLKLFRGPSQDEMLGRLVSSVRDLVTAHSDEFVRLRAGGVVTGGQALLMPSRPAPQLPALVGLLAASGAGFLGDEMVLLDPVLHDVFGLPFPLLVDSQDLSLFPDLVRERGGRRPKGSSERIQGRTPRRAVGVTELGSERVASAPLGRIVLPTFAPGEPTRFEPLPSAEALFRLAEAVLNLHIWGDRAMILLRRIADEVPVQHLVVGSVADAAALLLSTPAPGATRTKEVT